ncbi:hypothetical protein HDV04_004306 [Boothiomyces sp. JEL0838]|nr:hypothetical protein HDV04_004306 [Boothiomyces sp. JEL0838]
MHEPKYDLKPIIAPRLSGWPLVAAANLVEWVPGLAYFLGKDSGLFDLKKVKVDTIPTYYPFDQETYSLLVSNASKPLSAKETVDILTKGFQPNGFTASVDYVALYKSGKVTPVDLMTKMLDYIEEDGAKDVGVKALLKYAREDILKQAQASKIRYQSGKTLGPLDGVPIAVKDEMNALPYNTNVGTVCIDIKPEEDAVIVQRLREAGAIIVGKTAMHELGFDVTNCNPFVRTPRNPYNLNHWTGGSSGGSGAIVASGVCPISLGADGGGSIRIPAAYNGIYGLKPTAARLPGAGAYPLAPSVGVVGPLASNAHDLALAYYLTAGPNKMENNTLLQPLKSIASFGNVANLNGVKIGVYYPYFDDADPEIVQQCKKALEDYVELGAKLVPITIPNLQNLRNAHSISIASEFSSKTSFENRPKFGYSTRLGLAIFDQISAMDLLAACRFRTLGMNYLRDIFQEVDVIVTPTTGITSPEIPKGALEYGLTDYSTSGEAMKYIFLANLLGIPAVSCPIGYSSKGMPIGIQFQARWWNEDLLLRLANANDYTQSSKFKKPSNYFSVLE